MMHFQNFTWNIITFKYIWVDDFLAPNGRLMETYLISWIHVTDLILLPLFKKEAHYRRNLEEIIKSWRLGANTNYKYRCRWWWFWYGRAVQFTGTKVASLMTQRLSIDISVSKFIFIYNQWTFFHLGADKIKGIYLNLKKLLKKQLERDIKAVFDGPEDFLKIADSIEGIVGNSKREGKEKQSFFSKKKWIVVYPWKM